MWEDEREKKLSFSSLLLTSPLNNEHEQAKKSENRNFLFFNDDDDQGRIRVKRGEGGLMPFTSQRAHTQYCE